MEEPLVAVDLDPVERKMLAWGLWDWGEPGHCTNALAVAMGFDSCADLWDQTERLSSLLLEGAALSATDWIRSLLATEIVWASEVLGSGSEASTTFGHPDVEALGILRSLQHKMLHAGVGRLQQTDHPLRPAWEVVPLPEDPPEPT